MERSDLWDLQMRDTSAAFRFCSLEIEPRTQLYSLLVQSVCLLSCFEKEREREGGKIKTVTKAVGERRKLACLLACFLACLEICQLCLKSWSSTSEVTTTTPDDYTKLAAAQNTVTFWKKGKHNFRDEERRRRSSSKKKFCAICFFLRCR